MQDKLTALDEKLHAKGANALLVSTLDDICWLLNMRGSDINFNPVFFAYALVLCSSAAHPQARVRLYIDADKTANVREHLSTNKVEMFPYEQIGLDLESIPELSEGKVGYDENSCNFMLFNALRERSTIHVDKVLARMKAVKNDVEFEGMKRCQLRDGAAVVRYFAWLEQELAAGRVEGLTEYTGALKCEEFRAEGEHYMGLSFGTISSIGPNGSVIHYKP